MDTLPDALLVDVLSYLPQRAHLPTCHVSRRFRASWIKLHKRTKSGRYSKSIKDSRASDAGERGNDAFLTSPLQIGNLFESRWSVDRCKSGCGVRTKLLEYYASCGWDGPERFRRVMIGAILRGDVGGMAYLVDAGLCLLDDPEYCSTAGAAGRLEALRWMRERGCPWDAAEVYQDAEENLHDAVMEYVVVNSDCHDIQPTYGIGLPWS
uniref:F-box domain-containing protein n=1 Tax=Trieres chinensis TaxID=1514140 RepID=A0A7S2A5T4_TRICV|mmetsp:Transcript_4252/g.8981  ORF Transcript_4252/g.8981 Transcript_4252/m.8981 type:complete len:209 (+) Transcript_4252:140-766(+)